jgi:hypothetical protein
VTYVEVLLLIEERGEKHVSDKTHSIQTDKFIYSREPNGSWEQKELPITTIVVDPFPPLESVLPVLPKSKKKK